MKIKDLSNAVSEEYFKEFCESRGWAGRRILFIDAPRSAVSVKTRGYYVYYNLITSKWKFKLQDNTWKTGRGLEDLEKVLSALKTREKIKPIRKPVVTNTEKLKVVARPNDFESVFSVRNELDLSDVSYMT